MGFGGSLAPGCAISRTAKPGRFRRCARLAIAIPRWAALGMGAGRCSLSRKESQDITSENFRNSVCEILYYRALWSSNYAVLDNGLSQCQPNQKHWKNLRDLVHFLYLNQSTLPVPRCDNAPRCHSHSRNSILFNLS